MNAIARWFGLAATAALLAGCALETEDAEPGSFGLAASEAAAAEVRLVKASSYRTGHYGIPAVEREFLIRVRNIAYDKVVAVHHSSAGGGAWLDMPAEYLRPAGNGWELWRAQLGWNAMWGGDYPWQEAFAIKYGVEGQTYWDNGDGHDYRMAQHTGPMLGPGIHVLLEQATLYMNTFSGKSVFYGNLDVRNLAYEKQVEVVFSTDGWNTVQQLGAGYAGGYHPAYASPIAAPNAFGTERWSFERELDYYAGSVEFAIAYTVDGQTYWDNNFGQNYVVYSNN